MNVSRAPDRRQFLKTTAATAAATMTSRTRAADAANERIVTGIIGPGGMGMNHLRRFAAYDDVAVAYVCDPDAHRLAGAAKAVEERTSIAPKAVKDMREIFDDPSVDAVVIATPDHWHAPASILACDAGKHVYVEKPCSHNVREGRMMVDAARRNKRVVQVGTQSRSTAHVRRAVELLRAGAIGEVLSAKAWNSQRRGSIGKSAPEAPPDHLDFDLWTGPAPSVGYRPNMLHGSWRWWHAFGCGDIGNDGVHDIDIASWGLGVETHPSKVTALGGTYFFDDDMEWPDTQTAVFEYAAGDSGRPKQLIFEQRIWSPYVQEGYENGNAWYGTEGMMLLGKGGGWKLFGERNKLIEQMDGRPDLTAHHRDFLRCIREGEQPNADIEAGHRSASLCHLANIATLTGRTIRFDPASEQIEDDDGAHALLGREYRDHWAKPTDG